MDQISEVVGSLVGGLALVWLSVGLTLAVVSVYLLTRAHNMGTIRFSVSALELWFARGVALIMVLVTFVATVNILTAVLSFLFGDSFAYGGGSRIDELEELARWIIYGALAIVIYIFMLVRARQLADSPSADFIRNAFALTASGIFCITSIVYTFRLAGALIDRAIESGDLFDRSPAVGQPLVILIVAVAFFILAGYFLRRREDA